MRAHLGWDAKGEFFETLRREVGPAVELTAGAEPPASPDYAWLVSGVPSRDLVTASPNLKGLIIPWAGLPLRTSELLAEFPHVVIHNLHHNAAATAEMAVGLMISAAKQIVPADGALRQGDWSFRYADWSAPLLEGKTAVIVGFGSIGRRVGAVCQAMNMGVVGVRRGTTDSGEPSGTDDQIEPRNQTRTSDGVRMDDKAEAIDRASASNAGESLQDTPPRRPRPGDSETVSATHLEDVLPWADVLIIAVPATTETQGLFDAARLELLPDGAIVVNVARGAVVDPDALYEGLRSGSIGAAGIDVWYQYPQSEPDRKSTFPAEQPFHELENVVRSPHRAGHTRETEGQRASAVAELLLEAAEGRPMRNRVRLDRGY